MRHVKPNRLPILLLTMFAAAMAPMRAQAQAPAQTRTQNLTQAETQILAQAKPPAAAPAAGADMTPKPGSVFKDCDTCPEMVVVPAGIYIMGLGAKRRRDGPPHRVNFKKPFAVGRYEVTFREWFACVDAGGCSVKPDDHKWGTIKRPVINITWDQAAGYAQWLSRTTGHKYRLPTEAEWEYVHRGGTTTRFWWGDDVGTKMANCRDCESRACCTAKDHACCSHGTTPIGSFPPNAFGVYDTTGNVFEWTADCWNGDHKDAPKDGAARTTGDCNNRVIRGGSFYYFSSVAESYYRAKNPPEVKSYWLGFRLVREVR